MVSLDHYHPKLLRRDQIAKKQSPVQNDSIARMQSVARSFLVRQRLQAKKRGIVFVQSLIRKYLALKSLRERRQSAIVIQSKIRSYLQRKKYLAYRKRVIGFQSHVRCFIGRKKFLKLKKAAIYVQSKYKMKKMKVFEQTILAVTQISSWWKMVRVRRRYKQQMRELLVIQRVSKRFLSKRRNSAAVKIQAQWRGYKAQKSYKKESIRCGAAATTISAWWKMVKAKNELKIARELLEIKQNEAAIIIQITRDKILHRTKKKKRNSTILFRKKRRRLRTN